MAQIKIYGLRDQIGPLRAAISDAIHACAVEALELPQQKRFHRFLLLEAEDFIFPPDRSARYTIIEVSMFEGRSANVKKRFIRALFDKLWRDCALDPQDVEITITETPRENWGIRGHPGDELSLGYTVTLV